MCVASCPSCPLFRLPRAHPFFLDNHWLDLRTRERPLLHDTLLSSKIIPPFPYALSSDAVQCVLFSPSLFVVQRDFLFSRKLIRWIILFRWGRMFRCFCFLGGRWCCGSGFAVAPIFLDIDLDSNKDRNFKIALVYKLIVYDLVDR